MRMSWIGYQLVDVGFIPCKLHIDKPRQCSPGLLLLRNNISSQPVLQFKPILIAKLNQVIAADLQTLKRISSVGVILLDQEVFAASRKASLPSPTSANSTRL